jgi:hypothetical protein
MNRFKPLALWPWGPHVSHLTPLSRALHAATPHAGPRLPLAGRCRLLPRAGRARPLLLSSRDAARVGPPPLHFFTNATRAPVLFPFGSNRQRPCPEPPCATAQLQHRSSPPWEATAVRRIHAPAPSEASPVGSRRAPLPSSPSR